jgi:hypothetical protein
MKKTNLFVFGLMIFIIGCSRSEIEKIGIDNVEKQRAYQDSILNKKVNKSLFISLRELIAQYQEINDQEIENNPNYIYYMARLYHYISNIEPETFIDSTNNILIFQNEYKNMYDSAVYFANRLIEVRPSDIKGYYFLAYTLFFDNVRYHSKAFGKNVIYPIYSNRNPTNYANATNLIYKSLENNFSIDTSNNKEMSQSIGEIALKLKSSDLVEKHNGSFSESMLVDFTDTDLQTIIDFSKMFERVSKIKKYIFINDGNRENFKILSSFAKPSQTIYKRRHFWDNVTADVYKNGNCNKIWIFSNGLYTQELYEQNLDNLPYHERMETYTYDIINCSVKNLPLTLTHQSKGRWTKNGSTYYFYPINVDNYIIAGNDDQGKNYMFLNGYDNLEYLRSDLQTVVMTLESKNCRDCVNVNVQAW